MCSKFKLSLRICVYSLILKKSKYHLVSLVATVWEEAQYSDNKFFFFFFNLCSCLLTAYLLQVRQPWQLVGQWGETGDLGLSILVTAESLRLLCFSSPSLLQPSRWLVFSDSSLIKPFVSMCFQGQTMYFFFLRRQKNFTSVWMTRLSGQKRVLFQTISSYRLKILLHLNGNRKI